MFGLGLGGLFDILRPLPTSTNPRANLSYCALLFALSVWALPLLLNAVPFDAELLPDQPLMQIFWLAGLAAYLLACTMFAVLRSGNRRAALAPASLARSAQTA